MRNMLSKLILLGVLSHSKKPMYGYEIKKQLEEWAVGEYSQISYGSIYYNLERMEREGLVTGEVVKNSKRPERKLYSITEKGKVEFMKLLRKNYFEIERVYYPFDVGVAMMPALSKEEVIKALDKRIRHTEKHIEMGSKEKAELEGKLPFFALAIFDHYLYHFEAEKKWLENLKKEVEKEKREGYFEDFETSKGMSHGKHC